MPCCPRWTRSDPWLIQRAGEGFVRRAHGDLHLSNLCLWRGRPVPFDALEFDRSLATVDLAYDLAFLLIDLDHLVDRAAANRVLNRYVARTGDVGLVPVLPAFLSIRAMVRAHVEARSGHATAWQPYLQAAQDYLRPAPAIVVAIGGLPGTGKSTLARALAPELGRAPGALILRSDEIRKRQHNVEPEQRLPQSAYSDAASQVVFATIADGARIVAARRALRGGRRHLHRPRPPAHGGGSRARGRRPLRRILAGRPAGRTGAPHHRPQRRCVRRHHRGAACRRARCPRRRKLASG